MSTAHLVCNGKQAFAGGVCDAGVADLADGMVDRRGLFTMRTLVLPFELPECGCVMYAPSSRSQLGTARRRRRADSFAQGV
jgi:hypothetical protein